jgi:hypothetical protein
VPHLQDLAEALEEAFKEAQQLFAAAPESAPSAKPARRKRTAPVAAKKPARAKPRRIAA